MNARLVPKLLAKEAKQTDSQIIDVCYALSLAKKKKKYAKKKLNESPIAIEST